MQDLIATITMLIVFALLVAFFRMLRRDHYKAVLKARTSAEVLVRDSLIQDLADDLAELVTFPNDHQGEAMPQSVYEAYALLKRGAKA